MRLQVLMLRHVYPSGTCPNLTAHAAASCRYLRAEVHAMVSAATSRQIGSLLGDVVMDVSKMVSGRRRAVLAARH